MYGLYVSALDELLCGQALLFESTGTCNLRLQEYQYPLVFQPTDSSPNIKSVIISHQFEAENIKYHTYKSIRMGKIEFCFVLKKLSKSPVEKYKKPLTLLVRVNVYLSL